MSECNAFQMAVVPQQWLDTILEKLETLTTALKTKSEEEINSQWVESAKVQKLLGISAKTWQTYRDERRIPFSQFGRKIFVRRVDLDEFMNQHRIGARDERRDSYAK